ncbi:MAG: tetratricopeptide repeat protein, partial [Leptolyngbya sp. DLM2.Bin15]
SSMGRYGEAEPLYARSLSIAEQQLGVDHPAVATSLNNLAGLYRSMGRYGEAEPLYIRALDIQSKTLPTEHPWNEAGRGNFRSMLKAALEAGQADQLSGHPMTQAVLRELREEQG